MKIMLYVNSYLPYIGGREMVVHLLAKSYQELGHDVRVVGPGCWWKHRKTKFSYPLHRWPRIPFLSKDMAWTIQLLYAYLLYKPDIIHAHSTYPTGYIAARLKKFFKKPLIITPHGEDIHMIPEIGFGQRLDPVQDKKIRYALEKAEFITAISDSVAQSISDADVPNDKIISISNGVDLDRFQRRQEIDIYDYFGFPSGAQLVVTTGNYHPRKGHEVLIESIRLAVGKNENIRLVVIGRTSDKLKDEVKNDGLDSYVKFTGPLAVPVEEVSAGNDLLVALLNEAKIYVSSSIDEGAEGMSLALLEAMSAGACPVVTDISGNRDIVIKGSNGITVPPSSATDLSDAILQLLQDEDMQLMFRSESINTANKFGWIEIAKKYIDLYKLVINRRENV